MTPQRIEPVSRHAVFYARVSSQEQAKEGFSIPAQDKLLRAYGKEKQFQIAAAFTDIETAKRAGRSGFDAMVAFLRKNSQCRILLVEKTDRLYRNFRDWVTIDEIKELEVHFVKEGAVISDESRSSEKFIHGIKVLMAKNFIDNLKRGNAQRHGREGFSGNLAVLCAHRIFECGWRERQAHDCSRSSSRSPRAPSL